MNIKILYVSHDGMTDPLGQSQVLPYIFGIAKKIKCSFYLISCEKPDRFKQQKERIETICRENGVEWFPVPYHKRPPIIATLWDLRSMRQLAVKLQKKVGFSAVHCRAHMGGTIGLYLNKKFGIPIINDIRGFWADEKVDAGAWNRSNPVYNRVYKYFKKVERDLIVKASQQICLTYKAQKEIETWPFAKELTNITVIPCCVDTNLFAQNNITESEKTAFRKELNIGANDTILTYLGSIGSWYMLEEMLDFFYCFQKRFPNSKFLFLTFDQHKGILDAAGKRGIAIESIILRGAQRREVPVFLSISHASVFFIRPCYSKLSSSPTKQGEIMAMGIPVICNEGVGDTDMIVRKYHSGILINEFSEKAYSEGIEELLVFKNSPEDIRKGALNYFSLEDGINKYVGLYKKVLNVNGN
ncbi:glycosyltransferase [Niabella pedocola]|uniref:Glycosyltransferase n=1 Tax=Niabella pedocola TaxID=1752077 RepID=A0ABS8PVV2_9BACT|nr:glycosyltransferase [Niabella pedocola]MCD2425195.1 glycosyltransferase [Niabella pedocola]